MTSVCLSDIISTMARQWRCACALIKHLYRTYKFGEQVCYCHRLNVHWVLNPQSKSDAGQKKNLHTTNQFRAYINNHFLQIQQNNFLKHYPFFRHWFIHWCSNGCSGVENLLTACLYGSQIGSIFFKEKKKWRKIERKNSERCVSTSFLHKKSQSHSMLQDLFVYGYEYISRYTFHVK